jgi:hypothetical protein
MANILKPLSGSATAVARANVRRGAPNTSAPISRRLEKEAAIGVLGLTSGEAVAGQSDWYVAAPGPPDGPDEYVWAGALRAPTGGFESVGSTAPCHRRADGTVQNLSISDIQALYGAFKWTEGVGGAITPDPAWAKANIVRFLWPGVAAGAGATLWVHTKAKPHFAAVIAAISDAGLTSSVLTFDGSYVPRHMGWTPGRALSSHSWGIAIDINVRWNAYGVEPALLGAVGSVRQLVALFEAEGFAWGGRFQPDKLRDGMHFELARTDV